jgi:hypothetical protein
MNYYYLNNNQQPSGDYEVHRTGCAQGADPSNQLGLGYFSNGIDAVAAAKQKYTNVGAYINGCYYCSPESNTDK